jgi:diguanylate cyclase (GGDEF)-like protein
MKFHLSLESKICILIGVLLFALLFAVGYTQMSRHGSNLMFEKIEEYQGMSSMLALMCANWNGRIDLSQYHEFTTRFMESDPDISYVIISDSKGKVLFANTRKGNVARHGGFAGNQISKVLKLVRWTAPARDQECTMFRVPATVRPGERGTITVGFVSRSINESMRAMRSDLVYTFVFALLLGLLGALLIAKAVTMPMRQLISAARQVASGNLDISVPKVSKDEIGELVDTFNSMVAALKVNRDGLIKRANTDSLTGLHNHQYFQERLRSELKRAERYGRPLSVMMLDIDDFKVLNDTHGHPAGDLVLQAVAEILVAGARAEIDVVCRYGGEEFAIILPETSSADAAAVADRIRENIAEHDFTGKDGIGVSSTVSIGVAEYPTNSSEREGLISSADLALYQSKSMGKNRVTMFRNDTHGDQDRDPYRLYLLVNATDIDTVEAMAAAVDAKGQRSSEASQAAVAHAVELAKELGMTDSEQRDVRVASLLRDIGKLGVATTLLTKSGPLTDEELEVIRSHPMLGHSAVQKSSHLRSMLPGILYHHERWDGAGYPKGLKGEEIPLIARIVAVIDAYHAMTTERPHSSPKSVEDAKVELRRGAGAQFDPNIVEMFICMLERENAHDEAA